MKDQEKKLSGVFADVFGVESIDDGTSIATLEAWDSIAHLTLMVALEKEFDVSIATDKAIELTGVAEIKEFLSKSSKDQ